MEDLHQAVKEVIADMIDAEPKDIKDLEFTFKVNQEYRYDDEDKEAAPKKRKKRRGRQKGSKNKAKDDVIAGPGAE